MPQTARRYIEIEVDASKALRSLRGIEDASKKSEKSIGLLQKQMQSLGAQFRAFVGFIGVRELVGFADAAADISQRLGSVADSAAESEVIFENLLDIANRLGIGINELASSYTKLAVSVPTANTEELGQALDTISTILATTGASTQQVNAVLLQTAQALGSGALQGDEFRAVFENAPVLLRAWQEAAGLTGQSLRDLSSSAALTTESFFEFLPEIQKISAEMIGTSEVALTVARAFEILKNNIITLFTDSQGVSAVFTALAYSIKLVAENLDLLVTAALAFGAVKLAGMFAEAAVAAGLLSRSMTGLTLSGAAGSALIEGWVGLVDVFTGANRGAGLLTKGVGLLRSALNTALGSAVALFAAFKSWEWAVERIQEAAEEMDKLVEKSNEAATATKEFADQMLEIRNLDLNTASFSELNEASKSSTASISDLKGQINDVKDQLRELAPAATSIYSFEQDRVQYEYLEQQLFNLEKQLNQAEIASDRTTLALAQIGQEAKEAHVPFKELVAQLDALGKATARVDTRSFKLEAQLELVGLEGIDKIRAEVARQFEEPIQAATVKIAQATTKRTGLQDSLRTATTSTEEDALNKAIEAQNGIIQRNTSILVANATAQNESTDALVAQMVALEEATAAEEARGEAMSLVTTEFEKSLDVQFALQDLYAEGAISANQLADALNQLGDATGAEGFAPTGASVEELNAHLSTLRNEAALAETRLNQFAVGGQEAVDSFNDANAVMEAFNQALELQSTTLESATDAQLEYASAVATSVVRTQLAEQQAQQIQATRELEGALLDIQNAAKEASGALAAYQRGGDEGLATFEKQLQLQDAFSQALADQGTTYRNATREQLDYARQVTNALGQQLDAQEKLNRAQREASSIADAQQRVAGITAGGGPQGLTDVDQVGDAVDEIQSLALKGNKEAAQALYDSTVSQLEQLARDVEGPFGERELERAKRDLQGVAEFAFQEERTRKSDTAAAEAAAEDLVVPTLSAPVTFDEESLQNAIEEMQKVLDATKMTVQVTPELVGLGVEDALDIVVDQEGSGPA